MVSIFASAAELQDFMLAIRGAAVMSAYSLAESNYREIHLVGCRGDGRESEFKGLGAFMRKHH
jgi:hypothetical protein